MKIIKRRGKKKLYRQFQMELPQTLREEIDRMIKDHDALFDKITKKTNCNINEINFWEFREDNTYNELLKDPFYEFHEKRIREDIEREGDLDKLYEGLE